MKTVSPEFAAALAGGATRLCLCWRIDRADGAILGFTDHDRDISLDGVTYLASAGLSASSAETSLGLAVGDMNVIGVLSENSLKEADLAKGLYDGAAVTVLRVDWSDPSRRLLLRKAVIGEITRGEQSFVAELRSLADAFSQTDGRRYTFGCDADLGDARCGVDLTSGLLVGSGSVVAVLGGPRLLEVSGLAAFASGFFDRGRMSWTGGGNSGLKGEVKRHGVSAGIVTIELWSAPAEAVAPGDTFTVTAGCDKQLATCKTKFANLLNYQGFPYMPGNDWVVAYPSGSDTMDGGSRYND